MPVDNESQSVETTPPPLPNAHNVKMYTQYTVRTWICYFKKKITMHVFHKEVNHEWSIFPKIEEGRLATLKGNQIYNINNIYMFIARKGKPKPLKYYRCKYHNTEPQSILSTCILFTKENNHFVRTKAKPILRMLLSCKKDWLILY